MRTKRCDGARQRRRRPAGRPGHHPAGDGEPAAAAQPAGQPDPGQGVPAHPDAGRRAGDDGLLTRPAEPGRVQPRGRQAADPARPDREPLSPVAARPPPAGADRDAELTDSATAGQAPPALPSLRDTIARHGLDARKSLGQHFLLDEVLCRRIATLAGDLEGRQVLEVGPGPGGLTRALLASPAAAVTAVELDRRAVAVLAELEAAHPGRLRVIEADALTIDVATLLPAPRKIIANLPYNVATPLLVGWLRGAAALEGMALMFQQEVAERICAAPGTDAYGRLAVLAQWRCRCKLLLRLPPGAFTPPPKVWSAVVGFVPHPEDPGAALSAPWSG